MIPLESHGDDLCPFIDLDDPRCRSHFTLETLSHAFGHCVEDPARCPHYFHMFAAHPRFFALSCDGRPLQPTGS